MTKDELIEQLENIPGNPVVLVLAPGSDNQHHWKRAVGVGSTGEHRNGIWVYAYDENVIDYLGPVP